MRTAYILLLLMLAVACGGRKTIPERTLVKILAEMHTVDAALEQGEVRLSARQLDSTAVYTAILDKYGYTVTQLYNSMTAHSRSKEDAEKLYGKVCKRLEKQQKRYAAELAAERGDSIAVSDTLQLKAVDDGDTLQLKIADDSTQISADSLRIQPVKIKPARRLKFLDHRERQLKPIVEP